MQKAILLLALVPVLALALLAGGARPATTEAQSADATTVLQLRGSLLLLRTADAILERSIPNDSCTPSDSCRGSVLGLRASLFLIRTADAILERAHPPDPIVSPNPIIPALLNDIKTQASHIIATVDQHPDQHPGDPVIPALLSQMKARAGGVVTTADQWLALLYPPNPCEPGQDICVDPIG
jgi:hypothetical protein